MMILWLALTALAADEVRVGIFVGNDAGGPGQPELLFATADATKMRDAFLRYGDLDEAVLLLDQPRRNVMDALVRVRSDLERARAEGAHTVLVFYYSGHGDEEALQLGTSSLPHAELRQWLEETGADVRLALLDACQSGGAVRKKGGSRGPAKAFDFEVEQTRGTAFLTSSSASELSQESEDLGSGFFTYYLHSALLGAADRDGDGLVSLTETYDYVHGETTFHSRHAPGSQTPAYDFDLTGAGDLVLTRLQDAESRLVFAGDLEGTYAIWDETRRRYVAEVDGSTARSLRLPRGLYYVHHRMPGWVDEAVYALADGESQTVDATHFLTLAWEETAARGDLKRQVRRARRPDTNLQVLLGGRGFGGVHGRQYIPAHPLYGVQLRLLPERMGPYMAFDLTTGGGSGELAFGFVEEAVSVRSASMAAAFGYATGRGWARAGAAGRAAVVSFTRDFANPDYATQSTSTVSPGLATWLGLHAGGVNLDLSWNLHVLPVNWDGQGAPGYSELFLSFGYRF